MEFGVLGPLLVSDGSSVHAVSSGKQRALLAALLLRAGWIVQAEQLIETLWDGHPPRSADVTLRNYVARLRKSIGAVGARIRTSSGGYLFEAADEEIDVRNFDRLRANAELALRAGDVAAIAWILLRLLQRGILPDLLHDPLLQFHARHLQDAVRQQELRIRFLL